MIDDGEVWFDHYEREAEDAFRFSVGEIVGVYDPHTSDLFLGEGIILGSSFSHKEAQRVYFLRMTERNEVYSARSVDLEPAFSPRKKVFPFTMIQGGKA